MTYQFAKVKLQKLSKRVPETGDYSHLILPHSRPSTFSLVQIWDIRGIRIEIQFGTSGSRDYGRCS